MKDLHRATSPAIDRVLYRVLRLAARIAGASVDEVLRSLAARDSQRREGERKRKLTLALARLSTRSRESDEADAAAFARAEVTVDDPLRSVRTNLDDAHGVGAAFARPVE